MMRRPSKSSPAVRTPSSSAATGRLRPRAPLPRGGVAAPAGSAAARVCTRALWRGGTPASLRAVVAALEGKDNPLEASFRTSSFQLTAFSALIDELPLCAADECCDDPSVLLLCSTLNRSLRHHAGAAPSSASSAAARVTGSGGGATATAVALEKDQEKKVGATGVCAPHVRGGKALRRAGGGGGRGETAARVAAGAGRHTTAGGEGARGGGGIEFCRGNTRCAAAAETAGDGARRRAASAVAARQGGDEGPEKRDGARAAAKRRERGAAQEGWGEDAVKDEHYVEDEQAVREAGEDGEEEGRGIAASLETPVVTASSERDSEAGASCVVHFSNGLGRSPCTVLSERYRKEERCPPQEELSTLHAHRRNADLASAAAAAQLSTQTRPAALSTCVGDVCVGRHKFSKTAEPQHRAQQQQEQQHEEPFERQQLQPEQQQQLFQQQQYFQQQQQYIQQQQQLLHPPGPNPPENFSLSCGPSNGPEYSFRSGFWASSHYGPTSASGHGLLISSFPASFPASFPTYDALPYEKGADCSAAAALPYSGFPTRGAPAPPCSSSIAAAAAAPCLGTAGSAANNTLPSSRCAFDTFTAPYHSGYAGPAPAWGGPFAAAEGSAALATGVDGVTATAAAAADAAVASSNAAAAGVAAAVQPWEGQGIQASTNSVFSSSSGPSGGDYEHHPSLHIGAPQQQLTTKQQQHQYECTSQNFLSLRQTDRSTAAGGARDWPRTDAAVEQPTPSSDESRRGSTFSSSEPVAAVAAASRLQNSHPSLPDGACIRRPYPSPVAADGAIPTHEAECGPQAQLPLPPVDHQGRSAYGGTEGNAALSAAFSTHDVPHTLSYASASLPAEAGGYAATTHVSPYPPDASQQLAYCSRDSCSRRSNACLSSDAAFGRSNSCAETSDNNSSRSDGAVHVHDSSSSISGTVRINSGYCSNSSSGIVNLETCCTSSGSVSVCFCRGTCSSNGGSECLCRSSTSADLPHRSGDARSSSTDSRSGCAVSVAGRPTASPFPEKEMERDASAQDNCSSRTHAESSGSGRECLPCERVAEQQGPQSAAARAAPRVLPITAESGVSFGAPVANEWPGTYAYCGTPPSSAAPTIQGTVAAEDVPARNAMLPNASVSPPYHISAYAYGPSSCNVSSSAAGAAGFAASSSAAHPVATLGTADTAAELSSIDAAAAAVASAGAPSGSSICPETPRLAAAASFLIAPKSDVPLPVAAAADENAAEAEGESEGYINCRPASLRAETFSKEGGEGAYKQEPLLQEQRRSYSTCCSSGESFSSAHPWNRSSRSSSFGERQGEREQQQTHEPQEVPRGAAAERTGEEMESERGCLPEAEAKGDVEGAAAGVKTISPSLCFLNSSGTTTLDAGEFRPPGVRRHAAAPAVQTAAEEHGQHEEPCLKEEDSCKDGRRTTDMRQGDKQGVGLKRRRDADGEEETAEEATAAAADAGPGEAAPKAAAPIAVEVETVSDSGPENLLLCFKAVFSKQRHAFYVNRLDLLLLAAAQLSQLRKTRQRQKQSRDEQPRQQQNDSAGSQKDIAEDPAAVEAADNEKHRQLFSTASSVHTAEMRSTATSGSMNNSTFEKRGDLSSWSAPQVPHGSCRSIDDAASPEKQALTPSPVHKKPRTESNSGTTAAAAGEEELGVGTGDADEDGSAATGDRYKKEEEGAKRPREAAAAGTAAAEGTLAAAKAEEAALGAPDSGLKPAATGAAAGATASGRAETGDPAAAAAREDTASKNTAVEDAGVEGSSSSDEVDGVSVREGFSGGDLQQQQQRHDCRSSSTTTAASPVALDDDVEKRSREGKEKKGDVEREERSSSQRPDPTTEGSEGEACESGEESGEEITKGKKRLSCIAERGLRTAERQEALLMEEFAQEDVLQALLEELLQREQALKKKERQLLVLQQQLQKQQQQRVDGTRPRSAVFQTHNWSTRQEGEKGQGAAAAAAGEEQESAGDASAAAAAADERSRRGPTAADGLGQQPKRDSFCDAEEAGGDTKGQQRLAEQPQRLTQQDQQDVPPHAAERSAAGGGVLQKEFFERKARYLAQLEDLRPLLHATDFKNIKAALTDCRTLGQLSMWVGGFEAGDGESAEAAVARLLEVAEYVCGWAAAHSSSTYSGTAAAVTPYMCVWPSPAAASSCDSFSNAPSPSATGCGNDQGCFPALLDSSGAAAAAAAASTAANAAATSLAVATATPYWTAASVGAFPAATAAGAERRGLAAHEQTPASGAPAEGLPSCPAFLQMNSEVPCAWFGGLSSLHVSGPGDSNASVLRDHLLYATASRSSSNTPLLYPYYGLAAVAQPGATTTAGERATPPVAPSGLSEEAAVPIRSSFADTTPADASVVAALVADPAWRGATAVVAPFAAVAPAGSGGAAEAAGGDEQGPAAERVDTPGRGRGSLQRQEKAGVYLPAGVGKHRMPNASAASTSVPELNGESAAHVTAAAASSSAAGNAEVWQQNEGPGFFVRSQKGSRYRSPVYASRYQATTLLGCCTEQGMQTASLNAFSSSFTAGGVAADLAPPMPTAAICWLQEGDAGGADGEGPRDGSAASAIPSAEEMRRLSGEPAERWERSQCSCCSSMNSNSDNCRSKDPECCRDRKAVHRRLLLHTEVDQEQQHVKERLQQQLSARRQHRSQEQQRRGALQHEQQQEGEEQRKTFQGPSRHHVPEQQQETMPTQWQQCLEQQQQEGSRERQHLLAWERQDVDSVQEGRRRSRRLTQRIGQRTPTRQPEGRQQENLQQRPTLSPRTEVHHADAFIRHKRFDTVLRGDGTGTQQRHGEETTEAAEEKTGFVLRKSNTNSTEASPREEGRAAEQDVEAVSFCTRWSPHDGRDQLQQQDTTTHSPKIDKRLQQQAQPTAVAVAAGEKLWKKRRCSSAAPGGERSNAVCTPPPAANKQDDAGHRRQLQRCRQQLGDPALSNSENQARTAATAAAAAGREDAVVALEENADEQATELNNRTSVEASSPFRSPCSSRCSSCSSPRVWSRRGRLPFFLRPSCSPAAAAYISPDLSPSRADAPPTRLHSPGAASVARHYDENVCTLSESCVAVRPHGAHRQQQQRLTPPLLHAAAQNGLVHRSEEQLVAQGTHADRSAAFTPYPSRSPHAAYAAGDDRSKPKNSGSVPVATAGGDGAYVAKHSIPSSPSYDNVHPHDSAASRSAHFCARHVRDEAPGAASPSPVAGSAHVAVQSRHPFPADAAGRGSRSRSLTPCARRRPTPRPSPSLSPPTTFAGPAKRGTSHSGFPAVAAVRQRSCRTANHGFSRTAAAPAAADRLLRNTSRERAADDDECAVFERSSSLRPSLVGSDRETQPPSLRDADRCRAAGLRRLSDNNSRSSGGFTSSTLPTCNTDTNRGGSVSRRECTCYVGCMGDLRAGRTVAARAAAAGETGRDSDTGRSGGAAYGGILSSRSKGERPTSQALGTAAYAAACSASVGERPVQRCYNRCLQKSRRVLGGGFGGGGLQLTRSISNSMGKEELYCRLDTEGTSNGAGWCEAGYNSCVADAGVSANSVAAARSPSPDCTADALQVWGELSEALSGVAGSRRTCSSSTDRGRVYAACDAVHESGRRRHPGASAATEEDEASEVDDCMQWNRERQRQTPLSAAHARRRVRVPSPWNRSENPAVLSLHRDARQQRWLSPSPVAGPRDATDRSAASTAAEKRPAVADSAAAAATANKRLLSVPGRGAATARWVAVDRNATTEGPVFADRPAPLAGRAAHADVAERLLFDKEEDIQAASSEREQSEAACLGPPRAAEDEYQRRIKRLLWEYRSISRSSSLRSIGCNRIQSTLQSRIASIATGEVDAAVSYPFLLSFNTGRELDCVDGVGAISLHPGGFEKVLFDFQFT